MGQRNATAVDMVEPIMVTEIMDMEAGTTQTQDTVIRAIMGETMDMTSAITIMDMAMLTTTVTLTSCAPIRFSMIVKEATL